MQIVKTCFLKYYDFNLCTKSHYTFHISTFECVFTMRLRVNLMRAWMTSIEYIILVSRLFSLLYEGKGSVVRIRTIEGSCRHRGRMSRWEKVVCSVNRSLSDFFPFWIPATMRPRVIAAYIIRRRVIETRMIDDYLNKQATALSWLSL